MISLVALAPLPADFAISDLVVAPSTVQPDQVALVTVQVTNGGGDTGTLNLSLLVNGEAVDTQTITLVAGASTLVAFQMGQAEEGTYAIQVGDLTGTLEVSRPLSPAQVSLANLRVTPAEVSPGEPVTASITLTNTGDLEGSHAIVLRLNNVFADIRQVKVLPNTPLTVELALLRELEGRYEVAIEGLEETASFTVVPLLTPAAFQYGLFTVNPASVQAGKLMVFTVLAENVGDEAGEDVVVLTIDGEEVARQTVTLGANTGQILTFQLTPREAGRFQATMKDLAAEFEESEAPPPALPVQVTPTPAPAPTPTPTPTATPSPSPTPTPVAEEGGAGAGLIIAVVVAVVAVVALGAVILVMLRRRRQTV